MNNQNPVHECFLVEDQDNGVRLDIFLSHRFSEFSRSRIQKGIETGEITVNNKVTRKSAALTTGDTVMVCDPTLFETLGESAFIEPEDLPLDILYEDDFYLVLNKPAGIVVHPGNGNLGGTLLNGIYGYLRDTPHKAPRLAHRLDKDTSGIIIAAKNDSAHEKMSMKFHDREIYKGYLGIGIGKYPDKSGVIEAPLGRSAIDPVKRTIREDGRSARTDYALLHYQYGISMVAFRLHTGRTHQIRVHASFRGFPIVQDQFYGGEKEKVKRLEPMERAFAYKIYTCFHRQALHARYLSFEHPYTHEKMALTAPLHEDFKKAQEMMLLSDEDLNVFDTPVLDLCTG